MNKFLQVNYLRIIINIDFLFILKVCPKVCTTKAASKFLLLHVKFEIVPNELQTTELHFGI